MSDMYRCMLNKQRERPRAVRVPLHEYKGRLTKYVRTVEPEPEPESDPSGSFVLFHADLLRLCKDRGVLTYSDAGDMWAIVLRHSEACPEDADDDSDKFADQR